MGDITSGDVKDDAAANVDFGGGGGSSSDSSNYNYSDLNVSPGAMGGVQVGGETRINEISPTSVPTVSPPMSPFQLGFGGAQKVPNYMDDLNTLMGGGGSSADASAVSVSDSDTTMAALRRGAPALMASTAPDFVTMVGGTSSPDTRPRPDPNEISNTPQLGGATSSRPDPNEIANLGVPNFVFDYGFGTTGSPQSPEDFRREEEKIASMTGGARNIIDPLQTIYQRGFTPGEDIGALYGRGFDPTRIASLLQSGEKGTQQEEAQKKTIGQRLQELGKKISDFTFSDLVNYIGGVLRGDPNFKGTPSSEIDPFAATPGPGPEVGGGVPSPSGTGGGTGTDMPVTTMPETPAETVIKKDPCPPGFKLDPILNQCMPIVKSAPTPPPMPTLPKPTAPTGGGIANVYPFTLTPPVGAPVGTVAPIRFTPK